MDWKDPKSVFFSQVFSSALSSFSSSSQRKKQASAHTRAVMWFQCLGPCGIVPSGGKPLRLCWHITTPIINSRSAPFISITSFFLSSFCTFLRLHLGSHRCPLAPSPLLTHDTFLLILPSQLKSYLLFFLFFSLHSPLRHTTLNDYHSLTEELLTALGPGRASARKRLCKWNHIGPRRWSDRRGSDDSTHLSQPQTIAETLQSSGGLYYHI